MLGNSQMPRYGQTMTQADRTQLYAVVRLDIPDSMEQVLNDPGMYITVKAVYPSLEQAEGETIRLNQLPTAAGQAVYFWQTTRYYP